MYIKRFTASTVKEAMKRVKADLGAEALILNTKKISTVGSAGYEVVAAVERDNAVEQSATAAPGPGTGLGTGPVTGSNNRRPTELYASMAATAMTSPPSSFDVPELPQSEEPVAAPFLSTPGAGVANTNQRIEEELSEIKDFCTKIMAAVKTPVSDLLGKIETEMLANGIDKRLVNNILIKTCSRLADEKVSDRGEFNKEMKRRVSGALKVEDPLTDGSVLAFVGPTGVGKTTTIAKLAAIHALKKKKRVALLTFDNYRIAAVEQLKVYGKLIGAPVELAKSPLELSRLIRSHADKDIILIDTAGRDRSNKAHLSELQELAALDARVKFNLVLSAQSRDTSLYESVRNFSALNIGSLTFTKLDESDVYGPIFNTMVLAGKSLAYLTNGQRVPEDIEVASTERLLDIFLPC